MKTKVTSGFKICEFQPNKTIYVHSGFYTTADKAKDILANMPPGEYQVIEAHQLTQDEKPKRDRSRKSAAETTGGDDLQEGEGLDNEDD